MDLSHITVNTQNSIRIAGTLVLYFDPFEIMEESHDADVILVTHQHFDHFQPESIAKIKKEATMLIAPESMREKAIAESGISKDNCVFLRPGQEVSLGTLTIEAVPAYNVGKTFHTKDKEWVGYVVRMDGVSYYVAGDTDANPDNETVSCDVALIPVGGHYTMEKEQAADFAVKLSPKAVIPTHYGSLIGNPPDGAEFKRLVEGMNHQIQVEIKL